MYATHSSGKACGNSHVDLTTDLGMELQILQAEAVYHFKITALSVIQR